MAYDPATDRVYLVTADFGPRPAATPENPRPRPPMIPGSFRSHRRRPLDPTASETSQQRKTPPRPTLGGVSFHHGSVRPAHSVNKLRPRSNIKTAFLLKTALLAALPIEIVNFWIIGYPAGAHGLSLCQPVRRRRPPVGSAASARTSSPVDRSLFAAHPSRGLLHRASSSAGYLDTAILLAAVFLAARLVLHTLRKLSSPMKHAH